MDKIEFIRFFKRTEDSFPLILGKDESNQIIVDTSSQFKDNIELIKLAFPDSDTRINAILNAIKETRDGSPERYVATMIYIELVAKYYELRIMAEDYSRSLYLLSCAMHNKVMEFKNVLGIPFALEVFRKMDFGYCAYIEDNEVCDETNSTSVLKQHFPLCRRHCKYFCGLINLVTDYIPKDIVKGVIIDYL